MTCTLLAEWTWEAPKLPVDSWWFLGVVLVLLVFFIWLIARLTTTVTEEIDPAEIDRQMLTAVSELHSQGELTVEEYRSIKGRLVTRLTDKTPRADSEDSTQKEHLGKGSEGPAHQTTEKPLGSETLTDATVETCNSPLDQTDTQHNETQ